LSRLYDIETAEIIELNKDRQLRFLLHQEVKSLSDILTRKTHAQPVTQTLSMRCAARGFSRLSGLRENIHSQASGGKNQSAGIGSCTSSFENYCRVPSRAARYNGFSER
jgi:hypothetical protein